MAGINVRRLDGQNVEVLADDGRVLARITGRQVRVSYNPAQPDVEDIDVREIHDADARVVADKVNEVLGVLRAARIIAEPEEPVEAPSGEEGGE